MKIRRIATTVALAAATAPLFVLTAGTPASATEPWREAQCTAQWKGIYWSVGDSLARKIWRQCMLWDGQMSTYPPVPAVTPETIDPTWGPPVVVQPRP